MVNLGLVKWLVLVRVRVCHLLVVVSRVLINDPGLVRGVIRILIRYIGCRARVAATLAVPIVCRLLWLLLLLLLSVWSAWCSILPVVCRIARRVAVVAARSRLAIATHALFASVKLLGRFCVAILCHMIGRSGAMSWTTRTRF